MMNEKFDTFPTNMFEMLGKIEKEDFCFRCSYYRVWYNGQVTRQGNGGFDVIGIVTDDILHVNVMDTGDLAEYTVSSFVMEKISLSRIVYFGVRLQTLLHRKFQQHYLYFLRKEYWLGFRSRLILRKC